jgi:hypothetical protein
LRCCSNSEKEKRSQTGKQLIQRRADLNEPSTVAEVVAERTEKTRSEGARPRRVEEG